MCTHVHIWQSRLVYPGKPDQVVMEATDYKARVTTTSISETIPLITGSQYRLYQAQLASYTGHMGESGQVSNVCELHNHWYSNISTHCFFEHINNSLGHNCPIHLSHKCPTQLSNFHMMNIDVLAGVGVPHSTHTFHCIQLYSPISEQKYSHSELLPSSSLGLLIINHTHSELMKAMQ